ncbi:MAG: cation diffusion facilitator family transporter [Sulfuricaulis sp.]
MSTGHSHGQVRAGHEKTLWIALALTTIFLIVEIVGAWVTGSLALLSDAAHMFTDAAALAISLAAMQIGKRIADRKRTFGYYRFEILAAAFNATLLVLVAIYILYEAYRRLRTPAEIQSLGMLVIAVAGLAINLISMQLLRAGSEDSLNVKGAYLEVWSDMLGSIGVIAAAIVIRFTGWNWVDSAVAAAIGLWVLPRTWTLLKESINILLQGVPKGIDLEVIESALRAIAGVNEIHDLHVWSLTSGKNVLSVHVVADLSRRSDQEILSEVDRIVRGFEIAHTTIQVEADGFHAQGHAPLAHDSVHVHRHDD